MYSTLSLILATTLTTLMGCGPSHLPVDLATSPDNRPSVDVPHRGKVKPKLDADPDDPAWASAAVIHGLVLPIHSLAPGHVPPPTEVRLMWDEDFLYIRFLCQADEIYTPEHGHDALLYKGDVVEVYLDSKGDGREYVELECNVNNDVFDQITFITAPVLTNTSENTFTADLLARDFWPFPQWTMAGLRTAASRRAPENIGHGWTVNFAIPAGPALRRCGISHYQPMTLRANLLRYAYPTDAIDADGQRLLVSSNWSPVVDGRPHVSPAAMGYLKLTSQTSRSNSAK